MRGMSTDNQLGRKLFFFKSSMVANISRMHNLIYLEPGSHRLLGIICVKRLTKTISAAHFNSFIHIYTDNLLNTWKFSPDSIRLHQPYDIATNKAWWDQVKICLK